MAPTTERDFDLLDPERQRIYRHLQTTNIHGSPDGPWFFIIARTDPERNRFELIGITDTSMLRPQVFALQDGEVQIGLVCSEKQAIDATLESLAAEDSRFCPVADLYWNARGGSATDGGSFIFSLEGNNGHRTLTCHDKFGKPKTVPWHQRPWDGTRLEITIDEDSELSRLIRSHLEDATGQKLFQWVKGRLPIWSYASFREALAVIAAQAGEGDGPKAAALARPDPAPGPAVRSRRQETEPLAAPDHGEPDRNFPGYSPPGRKAAPAATAGSILRPGTN